MVDEEVQAARAQYEQALRNFGNPNRNNASAGSIGTRNTDEQNLGLAARRLMRAGLMYPLKRKYNWK